MNNPITLLTSPWEKVFYELVSLAQRDLLIASPFLSERPLHRIVEIVQHRQAEGPVQVGVVTNLAVDHLLSGSLDIAALLHLTQAIPDSTVTYLPGLHAKVYVADSRAAVVTSANLTNRGLAGNREYGVLLRDPALVSAVRRDLLQYASLGNRVSSETLMALTQATQDLKATRRRADQSITARLRTEFERRVEATRLELLKARARNKTTHGIFCDTILYLLEKHGPLRTVEMHPLIQQIHPDLCDDSVDRVIDGVHFGKKWKHHVRNAQVFLRRKGVIAFDGQRWFRVNPEERAS